MPPSAFIWFAKSWLRPLFRKQIRKLQLVRSPEGKTLVFRFYDPRVMEMFLPTCDQEQSAELFEQVASFVFPIGDKSKAVQARLDSQNGAIKFTDIEFSNVA